MANRAPLSPSIDIVLVGYDLERTRRTVAHCERVFGSLPIRSRILVANAAELLADVFDGWTVLRGTNALGEFSGWQEGLNWLRARQPFTNTVFVNDTLGAYRHLSMFIRIAVRREIRALDGAQWIGFSEPPYPPGEFVIDGLVVRELVSSYFFVLTPESAARLDWKLYEPDRVSACAPGGSSQASFLSERLSTPLRHHLLWWLFEGWHRSEQLDSKNAHRMTYKARCICAELLLSARCHALGIALRDPLRIHSWVRLLNQINIVVQRWCTLRIVRRGLPSEIGLSGGVKDD